MLALVGADTSLNPVLCKCRSLKQVSKGNVSRGDMEDGRPDAARFQLPANLLDYSHQLRRR